MSENGTKSGYEQMGYYRMYFRNLWYGKWFVQSEKFKEVRTAESEVLKGFCQWIEQTFTGGCDEKMTEYLESHTELTKNPNGRYSNILEIDDNAYADVVYNTEFGNEDYPIRIYLYRKEM